MTARLVLLLAAWLLSAAAPFDPFGRATIEERPGASIPLDVPLTGADGRATTLRALADGRPLLLAPVLHNCPNLCGLTLAGLADAAAAQRYRAGRDFAVVAFGIDPAETPTDAGRALERLGSRSTALADAAAVVGPPASVRAVTSALGYRYAWDERLGQYAHVAAVAVLTPDGRLARWLYGLTPQPAALADAIGAARDGRTGGVAEQLILLCYHYDPATGQYSLAIERVIRIAAILTLAGLAAVVYRLRRSSP